MPTSRKIRALACSLLVAVLSACDTFAAPPRKPVRPVLPPAPPMRAASSGRTRSFDACTDDEADDPYQDGGRLFVAADGDCADQKPCFAELAKALAAAKDGDTIQLLPGEYRGLVVGTGALVRITGSETPEDVVIAGEGLTIADQPGLPSRGSIKIDHLTFRSCIWGVHVSTGNFADVRIEDSVFVHNDDQGAIGISNTALGNRIHVRIARNRIQNNMGALHSLHIDLPPDLSEGFCIRAENNLITGNARAIGISSGKRKDDPARFELINNTIADNDHAVDTSASSSRILFANNIFAHNQETFSAEAESSPIYVHHNLIDSGQFTGTPDNFAADPAFVDAVSGDYHLQPDSPAVDVADASRAPKLDLDGVQRTDSPELGAYELHDGEP